MIHFDLPGAELLEAGLTDLAQNKLSPAALAVCALRPRLNAIGVGVLELHLSDDAEILMYQALGRAGEPNPHTAMNAMLRRLDSYASAAEVRRFRAVTPKENA